MENKACPLCERMQQRKSSDCLIETTSLCVYQGPFSDRWPGHLMAVFKQHVVEQSDVPIADLMPTLAELVHLERAIRTTLQPARMNIAKFGNAVPHLHWHLIPRFGSEAFREKSPWELLSIPIDKLYTTKEPAFEKTSSNTFISSMLSEFSIESNQFPCVK